jgi:fatty acid kinase
MQTVGRLTAADLAAVITSYRDALRAHQDRINRLNVFPVPDGDTGTNMMLTLESVLKEMEAGGSSSMEATARAISHGSLMGARGNSGVILSQILRGLAEGVQGAETIGSAALVNGLNRAAEGAYRAVQAPVEGTILTVIRGAADAATAEAGGEDADLVAVLEAARRGANESLARTPDLLPVLKTAGVVDAGGAGLALLLDAFLHVADGRPVPAAPPVTEGPGAPGSPDHEAAGPRYEVMYLLEAPDDLIPAFREVWAGIGDSIVVVGGGGLWNCHVHTDDIGAAVEAALEAGRPRQIRVSDLWEQVEEERWVREAAAEVEPDAPEERVTCAAVAVCTGEGIRRIFRSLGVHSFVSGGQSMNPSTAELLAAIERAPGDQVVVLPNNKNIVAVADQAARQSAKPVRVINTRGIQEGFAALLEYDPEGDADSNLALMQESSARIVAGEVTRAVRASSCPVGPIAEGDYLGLSRNAIEVVAPDLAGAATGLLEHLIDSDHHEIVTVIAGEGATAAETRRITEWLAEQHPDVTVEVHHGGQPLYPYLFSIE